MARTITITRKSQAIDPFTGIYIYLDGQQIGMVKNGEEASFSIDDGRHLLKVGFSFNSEQALSPAVIREGTDDYRFNVYIKKGFIADKAILEEQYADPVPDAAEASPVPAAGKAAFCPSCGHKLGPSDNFCPKCGYKRKDL